jgi:hypothetical protein
MLMTTLDVLCLTILVYTTICIYVNQLPMTIFTIISTIVERSSGQDFFYAISGI